MAEKKPKNEDIITTVISPGSVFVGEFKIKGGAKIDGIINGNLTVQGALIVGETGEIKAERINATSAVISGNVESTLVAPERVHLRAPGRFRGSIKTKVLVIDEGASFLGQSDLPDDEQKEVNYES
ncbi:MAG: bactofilin family protein [bacterium]